MKISGILFDAFGTIAEITRPTHPFRQLLREGSSQGRKPQADDIRTLMTRNLPIPEAALHFGIKLSSGRLKQLEEALQRELASIRPFSDAVVAISALQEAGLKIAICSNLASPYGPIIQQLFPSIIAHGFSYELGCMKPAPRIYQQTCDRLGLQPGNDFAGKGRVVMIGDSPRCDRDGPRIVGIQGFLLRRGGDAGFSDLQQFAGAALNYQ
ncbi:HAD family hydrolase [Pseudomonas syringae]|uniref:FMN phosphatase YigB n=1 Tax=Pseudomonas syringae pv. actinidiae TaxID=103796 RepID=A0A2V0QER1_PSESF|nr:HAD family hydrolase [Pseudomonas syringae]BBI43268.1 (S)-2-haloacid dehalogenase [Pseudomonas syringae pv. actinidiae]GBH11519.1 FMN phosphatase YigB [Pseudomonas syringae pv. actinidiae]